jgi:hypothetical protein
MTGAPIPVTATATAVLHDVAAPVLPPTPTEVELALPLLPLAAEPAPFAAAAPDAPPSASPVTMPDAPVATLIAMLPPNRVEPLSASAGPLFPDAPETVAQPPSPV